MTLLAIDTAANLCAVCLLRDDGVLASGSEDIGTGHAERLMDMIETTFSEAGTGYVDLRRVVVSVGPGSFTGVRIGVAAARGLALALDIPSAGVSTLAAVAADARTLAPNRPVFAALDARRGGVYAALYAADGGEIVAPHLSTPKEAARLARDRGAVVAGSAAPLLGLPDTVLMGARTGSIEAYARLGAKAQASPPKPLYLRGADAVPQAGFAVAHREPAG